MQGLFASKINSVIFSSLYSSAWFLSLLGCRTQDPSSETKSNPIQVESIEKITIQTDLFEISGVKIPKVAMINLSGTERSIERCHQYWEGKGFQENQGITICRENDVELIISHRHLAEQPTSARDTPDRYGRLRIGDRSTILRCSFVNQENIGQGARSDFHCALDRSRPELQRSFAVFDAKPKLDASITEHTFVPTEDNPQWQTLLTTALPPGVYQGHGRTRAKVCQIRVERDSTQFEVAAFNQRSDGSFRKTKSALVSENTIVGALKYDSVGQRFSSEPQPAAVTLLGIETKTKTTKFYSRNIRVVDFENGEKAVAVGNTYCRNLQLQSAN